MVLPYALEFNGSDLAFAKKLRKLVQTVEFRWDPRWDVNQMTTEVMEDERHLGNNPIRVTFKDVLGIFEKMKNELPRQ